MNDKINIRNNAPDIEQVKENLKKYFDIKDLCHL